MGITKHPEQFNVITFDVVANAPTAPINTLGRDAAGNGYRSIGTGWIQTDVKGAARVINAGSTGVLAATTVAVAGLTTIGAAIDVSNSNFITVRIDNSGGAPILFDEFEIQISADGGSTFDTLTSTPAEYTSPVAPLVAVEKDLTTLAASVSGYFILDCRGIDQIRCQASANTTQSTGVTGTWSAN